jgi:FkbM family methyltransferase
MSSYSQHGEDLEIFKLLPATGRFLDIGAYRPKELSNTRLLYEAGWTGVMFEPSPENMNYLLDEYGYDDRITLVQALVGVNAGVSVLEVSNGPVSTTNAAVRALWATDGHYRGRVQVPCLSVENVTDRYGYFDFVNIDAEGESVDLFDRFMAQEHRPAVFCVEHDGKVVGIERLAARKGYRRVLLNETNIVFRNVSK